MARHKGDVVAQRPELFDHGADQCGRIAHREVGATDRTLEQNVADLSESRRAIEEDDVPGRMAGAVTHRPDRFPQRYRVAILQPAVGREGARVGQAVHPAALHDSVDPELVGLLRAGDLGAGLFLHFCCAARVI